MFFEGDSGIRWFSISLRDRSFIFSYVVVIFFGVWIKIFGNLSFSLMVRVLGLEMGFIFMGFFRRYSGVFSKDGVSLGVGVKCCV